jgi:hypothetical protein
MIDRYDTNIVGRLSKEIPPQVGPRRVAVDAQQCDSGMFNSVVEDVPSSVLTVEVRGRDETRPLRVESGET